MNTDLLSKNTRIVNHNVIQGTPLTQPSPTLQRHFDVMVTCFASALPAKYKCAPVILGVVLVCQPVAELATNRHFHCKRTICLRAGSLSR